MINAYIQGSYVRLDGKLAGIQGESMSRTLRLNFSPEWGELTKRILWLDARGKQVVSQPLVASADEVLENNGLVISVKIPGEALQYDGKTVFIVEGADENGAISLSAMAEMTVNPNDFYGKNAINATEPTPTEMQQLQEAVEEAIGVAAADKQAAQAEANRAVAAAGTAIENANMANEFASQAANAQRSAEKAALDASDAAGQAEAARQLAESYTNNPPVPGENGNWQVWDGEKYVDSGAQAEGKNGYTPTVKAKETSTGVSLTIKNYDEEAGEEVTQLVNLKNGENGDRGLPGTKGDSSSVVATETAAGVDLHITNTTHNANGSSTSNTQVVSLKHGDDATAGVFIATYGTTPHAEIKAAFDAGKACFCKSGTIILPLVLCSSASITFSSVQAAIVRAFTVNSADNWSTQTQPVMLKTGGTMTGPLTLSGDPTEDLHAATKAYVDAQADGGGEPEIFIATYGTTPHAEIKAAFDAGKACFCLNGTTTFGALVLCTAAIARFSYTALTTNIVLDVNASNVWTKTTTALLSNAGGLPSVTEADNGKFLRVVNGAWAAMALPSAEGGAF